MHRADRVARARRGAVAERVGFEPTVLSHTAFRERHLQPLGHLSVAESSKGSTGTIPRSVTARSGTDALRIEVRPQLGGSLAEDAGHDVESMRQTARLGQVDGRVDRKSTRLNSSHGYISYA